MIEILTDKILNYKDPKTMLVNQGDYYMEFEEGASYLVMPKSVVLFLNTGRIFRLTQKKCSDFEWRLHNDLYDIVSKSNDSRIEIPVERTDVMINNEQYHYFEVLRPNQELGVHFTDDVADGMVDNEYIERYIFEVSSMIKHLKTLCDKHNYYYLPKELLAPYKRHRDSLGYFWTDVKDWVCPIDKFIEKKLRTLYLTMLSIEYDFDYTRLMNLAERQWETFGGKT